MIKLFGVLLCVVVALAHDEYRGKCPAFPPKEDFDWNEVSIGLGENPQINPRIRIINENYIHYWNFQVNV